MHETIARARFHIKTVKKTDMFAAAFFVWSSSQGKTRTRL